MSRLRIFAIAAAGVALAAGVVLEDMARRNAHGRYVEEVQQRETLQRRYASALAAHEQLTGELSQERQHSGQLSEALQQAQLKMEEAVARLNEESRTVRELQGRLAAMQQHMDQLQGELVVALQARAENQASASAQVELDRIVVGEGQASPLQGRIVSVHPDWNFVVVSLGWDAVKIGETLSIVRNDQLLAKARVERVQEGICAAAILPQWKIADVKVDDVARAL